MYCFFTGSVTVTVVGGLPQLTVPLPSRRELCRFSLRPITHTVQDLIHHLQKEDRGIDRVVVTTSGEARPLYGLILTKEIIHLFERDKYSLTKHKQKFIFRD